MNDHPNFAYHEDTALFRDAIRFTSAETGFSERLIEKDYYLSVALHDLCPPDKSELVFKGGTCLSKVHTNFLRLSEDLDFAISTPTNLSRSQRSRRIGGFKEYLSGLPERRPCFRIEEALRGFNNSMQYACRIAYSSVLTGQDDFIKVEVSVREPIVELVEQIPVRTLLRDPFRHAPAVAPFKTRALSIREAYAEKLRAAMTRREPMIRDFFDLDHAVLTRHIDTADLRLTKLLETKLSIPATEPVDISPEKLDDLRRQVVTQLRPVLRESDFVEFDLDRAFGLVAQVTKLLRRPPRAADTS